MINGGAREVIIEAGLNHGFGSRRAHQESIDRSVRTLIGWASPAVAVIECVGGCLRGSNCKGALAGVLF